jgi:catechol 2,3-dioxygenase-like lactoylglutathione lyase family enzyme
VKIETALLFCEQLWGPEALPCCGAHRNGTRENYQHTMKPHISLITLGVVDLARSTAFYRDGLGLPNEGAYEGVAFFKLRGTWLSLFSREALAQDANLSTQGSSAGSICGNFTLAHNVSSKEEVDAVLTQAQSAGATLLKPAQDAFWGGYHGYFADLDGFVWEVAWNPDLDLT